MKLAKSKLQQIIKEEVEKSFQESADGPVWDEHAATELMIFIENDAHLYRQRWTPIVKNLTRKKMKDIYDPQKAEKLMMYLVVDGAKEYAKQYGNPEEWKYIFDIPTRKQVAKELVAKFEGYYQDENPEQTPETPQLEEALTGHQRKAIITVLTHYKDNLRTLFVDFLQHVGGQTSERHVEHYLMSFLKAKDIKLNALKELDMELQEQEGLNFQKVPTEGKPVVVSDDGGDMDLKEMTDDFDDSVEQGYTCPICRDTGKTRDGERCECPEGDELQEAGTEHIWEVEVLNKRTGEEVMPVTQIATGELDFSVVMEIMNKYPEDEYLMTLYHNGEKSGTNQKQASINEKETK